MESYSLFQLNEYIKRVIALNFREPLWIEAEIVQVKGSRGHYYLELIEKDETSHEIIAQASAAIWYRNFQFIKKKIGDLIDDLLVDGTQVRLKCQVDFNERYGFKLLIQDIDPNFTFGKHELKRQEIINRLETEGLMELNQSLIVPEVIQHLAIISSAKSAGFQDFISQLGSNSYGYQFVYTLYDVAVQGDKVERETCEAIANIIENREQYDAAIIIRGGGSKLDLAAYDNYEIAKAIAISELPFIIGIGHDIDTTVTDLVSCISLKTPTAVADFLIEKMCDFDSSLHDYILRINQLANAMLQEEQLKLASLRDRLFLGLKARIDSEFLLLDQRQDSLQNQIGQFLDRKRYELEKTSLIIDQRDPSLILSQGFAYVLMNGKNIKSAQAIKASQKIEVIMGDGKIRATTN